MIMVYRPYLIAIALAISVMLLLKWRMASVPETYRVSLKTSIIKSGKALPDSNKIEDSQQPAQSGKPNPKDFDDLFPDKQAHEPSYEKERRLEDDKFHIVQNFLLYTDPDFKESVGRTAEQSKARQKELDDTLQANLNHPSIGSIHIMYTNKNLPGFLNKLNLKNREKLILEYFNKIPTIGMFLLYIEKNLQKKLAIVSNQDIEYGEGWDKIDLKKFREQKLMYALSRHVKQEHLNDPNCYAKTSANCNPGSPDFGSFDLFAFYVDGKVPKAMVDEMDYTQATWGMENVFVWYAMNKWGYTVLNPCKVLNVYHIDCHHISIKGRSRQKTNHIGVVHFTNKLYKM